MSTHNDDLLDRYLPRILTGRPELATRIASSMNPAAAALTAVKQSPEYAFDREREAYDKKLDNRRKADWFRDASPDEFSA